MAENNITTQLDPYTPGKVGTSAIKNSSSNMDQINREFMEKSVMKRASELGIQYINIAKSPLNPDLFRLLTFDSAKNGRIVPFFRIGKSIRIAVEDAEKPETKTAIAFLEQQGYEISLFLASSSGIDDALKIYEATQQYKKPEIVENVQVDAIKTYELEIKELLEVSKKLDNVTAEEGLNMLNIGAAKTGASDMHYEPEENTVVVRFRIDGMLQKVFEIKPATFRNIANQIKYKSKMPLNIDNVPQDGRYGFNFNNNVIDVRVSSLPTPFGEAFVCRYLFPEEGFTNFDYLGFQGYALKKLDNVTGLSHGMVLCTGPTGSGKNTTLYSLLQKMKKPENKIITLEDPVEYKIAGVTQSQINEKRGYTFASGLRAILRQDPDIIMVGEIRDLETAETAAQAALTGHVLMSTLHTNSAIEAISRLVNMGLPRFMVASTLHIVIGQRLVRKVCPKCSTSVEITESEKKEFELAFDTLNQNKHGLTLTVPTKIAKVNGCDFCSQTGYKGRLVIAEVVIVDESMKRLILNSASSVDLITEARKDGMLTMREEGLIKVSQGLTTLEEVHRVTNIFF